MKNFYKNRPQDVQEAINFTFDKLQDRSVGSNWVLTSNPHYHTAELNEHSVMKSLINDSQDEYFILEVGSCTGQWIESIKEWINNDPGIPPNYKFNIIGLNGEPIGEDKKPIVKVEGKCTTYTIGSFKIENVLEELDRLKLDFNNKIDFIISNFTFRHLVDPVGTLIQIYDSLLKPETGIMLTDGFQYIRNKENNELYSLSLTDQNFNFSHLLIELKAQFITHTFKHFRSFDHFVIKKPAGELTEIPLKYSKLIGQQLERNSVDGLCNYHIQFESAHNSKVELENLSIPQEIKDMLGYDESVLVYYIGGSEDILGYRGSKAGGKKLFEELSEMFIENTMESYFYYADITLPTLGEDSGL